MSNSTFHYRNYRGSALISVEDNLLYGKVLDITDLVSYEADTVPGLKKAFEEAVDDYLDTCQAIIKSV